MANSKYHIFMHPQYWRISPKRKAHRVHVGLPKTTSPFLGGPHNKGYILLGYIRDVLFLDSP